MINLCSAGYSRMGVKVQWHVRDDTHNGVVISGSCWTKRGARRKVDETMDVITANWQKQWKPSI